MELHEERELERSGVRVRRKQKFSRAISPPSAKTHWVNHAGTYHDNEFRYPKYWHGQKPIRTFISIRSHLDLVQALADIKEGTHNQDHYHNVSGIHRARLRAAQSLRDRNRVYSPSFLARAGFYELKLLMYS
ncbi:hypothetical protein FJZ17_01185 [Candidatus Pacearchaeota archaeon]|nr:hypothetical protein [Candidatus Pacearchaeota archaeon]